MENLNNYIKEYKILLENKDIQKAYRNIIKYMMTLTAHFANKYSDKFKIGHFYQGYMDISYFTLTPISLKDQKLKIGIGLLHEKMQFVIWLGGQNKQIVKKYWEIFKGSDWNKYTVPSNINKSFSIVETILVEDPDFTNLNHLTEKIDFKTLAFIKSITDVLVIN